MTGPVQFSSEYVTSTAGVSELFLTHFGISRSRKNRCGKETRKTDLGSRRKAVRKIFVARVLLYGAAGDVRAWGKRLWHFGLLLSC